MLHTTLSTKDKHIRIVCIVVGVLILMIPAFGQAEEEINAATRYDEDWRFLGDEDSEFDDWWTPLKFVPTKSGYITFGGEARFRYESLSNLDWGSSEDDSDGYIWLRALPSIDWHITNYFRLFSQFIFADVLDRDPEAEFLDKNTSDVQQLFLELTDIHPSIASFSIGRRVTSFGSSRLVGTRYGVNVIRSFDAVEARFEHNDISSRLFYGQPVENETGAFDDDNNENVQTWSLYNTFGLSRFGLLGNADLYYIGFRDENASFLERSGTEKRHTFGLRVFGKRNSLDWNHELFLQRGTFANLDIEAWSLATEFGYSFSLYNFPARFSLKVDFISGDTDRDDNELGTFNPLFPSLKYFGEAGVVAPYNLIDVHPTIDIEFHQNWHLMIQIDFLWRYSTEDDVYGPGGGVIRRGDLATDRYIATQYEVIIEREISDNWSIQASYSVMPAGEFIENSGPDDTFYFGGLELRYIF
ncbi:MAG: alginate export family protein [Pseudomonadota bacterium]